jgi:hypothetical protein
LTSLPDNSNKREEKKKTAKRNFRGFFDSMDVLNLKHGKQRHPVEATTSKF